MKRSRLKRSTKPLRRTRLRRVSKRQASRLTEYYKVRKDFLATHELCEMGCGRASCDVHHRLGRGQYLCDVRFFLALCRPCHEKAHRFPAWARENGYLA